jgi:hypothetical protein
VFTVPEGNGLLVVIVGDETVVKPNGVMGHAPEPQKLLARTRHQ